MLACSLGTVILNRPRGLSRRLRVEDSISDTELGVVEVAPADVSNPSASGDLGRR